MARLAYRAYLPGDPLPAVGETCIVAGANTDITSDQDRQYSERFVVGYSQCGNFVCFQNIGCWPTVERLEQCWFAPDPDMIEAREAVCRSHHDKHPESAWHIERAAQVRSGANDRNLDVLAALEGIKRGRELASQP